MTGCPRRHTAPTTEDVEGTSSTAQRSAAIRWSPAHKCGPSQTKRGRCCWARGAHFHEGDGRINIVADGTRDGGAFRYRLEDGAYSQDALEHLTRLFGVPPGSGETISVRLIAMLDHLEDHFGAERIAIVSGFRSRNRNDRLRQQGVPTAKASLHMDGMAADVHFEGVSSYRTWEYLKGLDCCGAGYYRGRTVHVDTGPARFWVKGASGVHRTSPPPNRFVIARTDRDVYRQGERIRIKLARLSDYPVAVDREVTILKGDLPIHTVSLDDATAGCRVISGPRDRAFDLTIPRTLPPGEAFHIQVRFCDDTFPKMPRLIRTNPLSVYSPSRRAAHAKKGSP